MAKKNAAKRKATEERKAAEAAMLQAPQQDTTTDIGDSNEPIGVPSVPLTPVSDINILADTTRIPNIEVEPDSKKKTEQAVPKETADRDEEYQRMLAARSRKNGIAVLNESEIQNTSNHLGLSEKFVGTIENNRNQLSGLWKTSKELIVKMPRTVCPHCGLPVSYKDTVVLTHNYGKKLLVWHQNCYLEYVFQSTPPMMATPHECAESNSLNSHKSNYTVRLLDKALEDQLKNKAYFVELFDSLHLLHSPLCSECNKPLLKKGEHVVVAIKKTGFLLFHSNCYLTSILEDLNTNYPTQLMELKAKIQSIVRQ